MHPQIIVSFLQNLYSWNSYEFLKKTEDEYNETRIYTYSKNKKKTLDQKEKKTTTLISYQNVYMLYNDDDDDDFNASKTCNELRMKQNTPNGIGRLSKCTL